MRNKLLPAFAATALLLVCLPAHALQRAFVSSTGNDANTASNCILTAPCRTFSSAQSVVDPGGEIIALDGAGFGAITVTKSLSLIGQPGFYAGITGFSGNAVTIATAGVNVILRGLNINGLGSADGIMMTSGSSLVVENCVISNFSDTGMTIAPGTVAVKVRIVDTLVRGNAGAGILFQPGATGTVNADITGSKIMSNGWVGVWGSPAAGGVVNVSVDNTVSSGNRWGFDMIGGTAAITRSVASNNTISGFQTEGGTISVSNSMAFGNGFYGLYNSSGTLESQGNNQVRGNATNTSGTITSFSGT